MINKLLEISLKKDGGHSPLYRQLESEIIQLICRGILKPGQALPSSRDLAQSLQLNRKTVVATYEELVAQGWVQTRERSGVYISSQLPDTSARVIKQNSKTGMPRRQPAYQPKGTQMAIYLATQLLIRPGDTVFVPEPGYFDANQTFKLAGAELEFIPVDKEGMDVDRIEQLCKKKIPRMIYVIPHHHRPTTVTMSAERRMRLMSLACRYGLERSI